MKTIKIMVVDDQVLFRETLVRTLSSQEDMQVVAYAGNGREALEQAKRYRPDVILLDVRMPEMGGLEATKLLRVAVPEAKVVILTVSDAEGDVFEALKNGAVGYLVKSIRAETLFQKVRDIAQGELALSPLLASQVLNEFTRLKRRDDQTSGGLSEREREVLRMVVGGKSNKEIAEALLIAESTAKRHLHNILNKLQAKNRAEAAAYGARTGMT
ncbi:MAG: response regulator transcription factor [Dehalococcoidia bacterium]|nr:response regulator transcription factor [Dehalococcoidia bacterium]